jgi:hypothetical protein
LYDTLGEEASEFILNQTQSPIVVASLDHVPNLIQMKDKLPSLKIIVSMDDLEEGDLKGRSKGDLLSVWAKEKGLQLLSFRDGMLPTWLSNPQLRLSVWQHHVNLFRQLRKQLRLSIIPLERPACPKVLF